MVDKKQVYFRKVSEQDEAILLEWRNDAETRKQSFQTDLVTKEEHHEWFQKALKNEKIVLLLCVCDNVPIGTIRIEKYGLEADISYSIDSAYRGQGFGRKMIYMLLDYAQELNIPCLRAQVKADNLASQKILLANGFEKQEISQDQSKLIFKKRFLKS